MCPGFKHIHTFYYMIRRNEISILLDSIGEHFSTFVLFFVSCLQKYRFRLTMGVPSPLCTYMLACLRRIWCLSSSRGRSRLEIWPLHEFVYMDAYLVYVVTLFGRKHCCRRCQFQYLYALAQQSIDLQSEQLPPLPPSPKGCASGVSLNKQTSLSGHPENSMLELEALHGKCSGPLYSI